MGLDFSERDKTGMGMGLQYAVNFSTVPKDNCKTATAVTNRAENWVLSKNKIPKEKGVGFYQLQGQMEKLFEDCSREFIRNTMLKQEKMFKEQVQELHHLYKVQKTLMAELSKELRLQSMTSATAAVSDTRSGFWSSTSTSLNSYSSSHRENPNAAALLNSDYNFHQVFNNMAGPSAWGINAASAHTFGMNKGFNIEHSAREYSATRDADVHLQSQVLREKLSDKIGTESLHSYSHDDTDLELSLSIGSGTSKKTTTQKSHITMDLQSFKSASDGTRTPSMQNVTRPQHGECSEAPVICDQEGLQRPPWLFQGLSLNKT